MYNAPFGLSVGGQFYVRSGLPISRFGFFNNFYPDLLFLDQRGSNGRTPTDYDLNLSVGYNINIGPVTVTPQAYLLNALNRQTVTSVDATFNPSGSFVRIRRARSSVRPASSGNGRTRWRHLHRVHALPGQPGLYRKANQPATTPVFSVLL